MSSEILILISQGHSSEDVIGNHLSAAVKKKEKAQFVIFRKGKLSTKRENVKVCSGGENQFFISGPQLTGYLNVLHMSTAET